MVATIVDSARNANAVVVGQVVGREQQKINNLEWGYLTAAQWSAILKEFSRFYVTVSYPDMVNNRWTTRKMYPGDRWIISIVKSILSIAASRSKEV